MKMPLAKLTLFLTMLASLGAMTSPASADIYDHIDSLAVRIQNKARQLTRETVHYRHTPRYRQLVAETEALYRTASHIHDVTHFEGNLFHLERDLRDLDRCFHRLEDLFDITEHGSSFGHGHVHGNTAHVKRLLNSIEDAIHHLQEDVEELQHAHHRPVYRPVYRPLPVTPGCGAHPVYGGHGRATIGFTIGGGSSRIYFGF